MRTVKILGLFLFVSIATGCSAMQYYYIQDAKLAQSSDSEEIPFVGNRKESINLLLNGHYIKAGNSLVLLIRKFDKGSLFSVDDETYEKLTIEIKKYEVGVPMSLNSSNIKTYYSSGSSGFVRKGHGVYADLGKGNITIKKINKNKIVAELDFTARAEPTGVFPHEGRTVVIQDSFVFNEKRIADLTPWLGIPDASLGKEVYP